MSDNKIDLAQRNVISFYGFLQIACCRIRCSTKSRMRKAELILIGRLVSRIRKSASKFLLSSSYMISLIPHRARKALGIRNHSKEALFSRLSLPQIAEKSFQVPNHQPFLLKRTVLLTSRSSSPFLKRRRPSRSSEFRCSMIQRIWKELSSPIIRNEGKLKIDFKT